MNPLAIAGLATKALDLIAEAVTDQDQRNALNAKIVELQTQATIAIVQTPTVPWVDALVKLTYALVALAAPLGTAAMTAIGIYAHFQGVSLGGEMTHGVIDSAFLAWRGARHFEKKAGVAIPAPPSRSGPPR